MASKNKGGRPKIPGKRVPTIFRMDESLAKWYTAAAAERGQSRTQYMQKCLGQWRLIVERLAEYEKRGMTSMEAFDVMGHEFAWSLVELGLANEVVRAAVSFAGQDNRAIVRLLREGKLKMSAGEGNVEDQTGKKGA